jgi:hypothetical protein
VLLPAIVRLPQRQQSDTVTDTPCEQRTTTDEQFQQFRRQFQRQQPQPIRARPIRPRVSRQRPGVTGSIPFRAGQHGTGKSSRQCGST